jgi:hypothetical protein
MTNGAYREWEIMWANENPHAHHTDGPIDEDAYRRGFQQGSEAALEAIKAGMPRRRTRSELRRRESMEDNDNGKTEIVADERGVCEGIGCSDTPAQQ